MMSLWWQVQKWWLCFSSFNTENHARWWCSAVALGPDKPILAWPIRCIPPGSLNTKVVYLCITVVTVNQRWAAELPLSIRLKFGSLHISKNGTRIDLYQAVLVARWGRQVELRCVRSLTSLTSVIQTWYRHDTCWVYISLGIQPYLLTGSVWCMNYENLEG